jgi:hypothetical protein
VPLEKPAHARAWLAKADQDPLAAEALLRLEENAPLDAVCGLEDSVPPQSA